MLGVKVKNKCEIQGKVIKSYCTKSMVGRICSMSFLLLIYNGGIVPDKRRYQVNISFYFSMKTYVVDMRHFSRVP